MILRNQLSSLPAHVCSLPLKVLIACNNKLVSLPEELGQLRQLTELDVSCNEIQMHPLRNHLASCPPGMPAPRRCCDVVVTLMLRCLHVGAELAELPLVRLDFSCNKVTSIPVCYRNLRHLQSIVLDNNPLQSPPAQICIKGKIHIFKYLNMEACKAAAELPDFDRRPMAFGSCPQRSCRSCRREWPRSPGIKDTAAGGATVSNGNEAELEQMDFIDSSCLEEDDEGRSRRAEPASLSSQFMAYIERRITRERSPVKARDTRTDDSHRHSALSRSVLNGRSMSPSAGQSQRAAGRGWGGAGAGPGATGLEHIRRGSPGRHAVRGREAQGAPFPKEVLTYAKLKAAQSLSKHSLSENESTYPSRRSTHTDDSALFMSEDRSPSLPPPLDTPQPSNRLPVLVLWPRPQPGPRPIPSSLLIRLGQRGSPGEVEAEEATPPEPCAFVGEEAELVEQLRKNIESRLKVSLPSDLGAALTDGVVLCHLANHVRPRSVPSIHVPSPAVPKLTMAKCRRNVENFLEACRRLGVPQAQLCLPLHILEEKGLPLVAGTVRALLELAPPKHTPSPTTAAPPVSI
ncbi:hypothetical protein ANANG_G00129530 [Anguilla anguilla]|uniref:Calponin-homology (CH) domain-containing protein n=1 Tax=Anguilla anguilla TaxID=7936 RepID=A0A9D3MI89_ANGAN|nr:hypothetical protein ANANG_G00129530 [Anguilla anguilla]